MKVLRKAVPNPCNENSLNELNNVQSQLEYIEQNIKIQNQISESLKAQGIDYRPSNMDQLFKSSYEGQYHKLVDKVNANLNKTVQNYQQYNNVVTGNAPYIKGQQGVNSAIDSFVKKGGRILNNEVTVNFNGTRIRADAVGELNGKYYIIEAKNGLGACFTPNQGVAYPNLPNYGIPVGQNAIEAGLKLNQSYNFYFFLHWID